MYIIQGIYLTSRTPFPPWLAQFLRQLTAVLLLGRPLAGPGQSESSPWTVGLQQQQIHLVNGSTPCPCSCSSPLKSISSLCFALLAATCLHHGRRSALGTRRAARPRPRPPLPSTGRPKILI